MKKMDRKDYAVCENLLDANLTSLWRSVVLNFLWGHDVQRPDRVSAELFELLSVRALETSKAC